MNCDGVSNLLSAYLDGELSPGELLRVEEHLRRCHACADEVDSLRQTIALVASLDEVELPASFGAQLHNRLVAAGPPLAAVRRTPAAPAWQRNLRRFALPAAAAAAALAIGITSFDQVATQLPGLTSESIFNLAPAKVTETPTTLGTNPDGNVSGTQQPTTPPVVQPPVPNTSDKPPVNQLPPSDPGRVTTNPDGPKGVDSPAPTEPTKAEGKFTSYTTTITVQGALDPKVEEKLLVEYTRVEKADNTLTVIVPSSGFEQWLSGVLKYFPGAQAATASVPLDTEIAQAEATLNTARLQLEHDQKNGGPDKEATVKQSAEAVADAQEDLDFLMSQAARATIIVTFSVAP